VLAGLADAEMSIRHNGAPAGSGRGEACLGNPAIAVAWLAEALTRFGEGLRAGDLVMSGALAKMIAATPGDKFAVDFGALGSVSVTFEA
jgi:2-keto-4-pentenoate hydratase